MPIRVRVRVRGPRRNRMHPTIGGSRYMHCSSHLQIQKVGYRICDEEVSGDPLRLVGTSDTKQSKLMQENAAKPTIIV